MINLISHRLNEGVDIPDNALEFDLRVFNAGGRFRCDFAKDGYNDRLQRSIARTPQYEAIERRVLQNCKKQSIFVFKCWCGRRLSVAVVELIADSLLSKGHSVWTQHQELERHHE